MIDDEDDEFECGHDWDMSCPPCPTCGGCPECGDCDCGIDDDWFHDPDMEAPDLKFWPCKEGNHIGCAGKKWIECSCECHRNGSQSAVK